MAKRVDARDEIHINNRVNSFARDLVTTTMSFHYSPMVEADLDRRIASEFPGGEVVPPCSMEVDLEDYETDEELFSDDELDEMELLFTENS